MGKNMCNTRNLRKRRGGGWAAVVYVPVHLQKIIGKKEIVRGLDTSNLPEANRRKLAVITAIQTDLVRLTNPKAELEKTAKRIAETLDPDDEMLDEAILVNAHTIEARHGTDVAVAYYKTATRQRFSTSAALEMWMEESDGITKGTKVKYRGHVQSFIDWSNDTDINKVDRRMAGAYAAHVKKALNWRTGKPPSHQTVVHSIRAVGRLWKWLGRRGFTKEDKQNPWSGQVGAAPGEKRVKK